MTFDDIMKGFMEAQIEGGSAQGLAFLNGVNTALAAQLSAAEIRDPVPNQHMSGFNAGREIRKES